MNVRVVNGSCLSCTTEVKRFEWWIQGHTFQVDAKVINMGASDLVLGMGWLEKFRPMTCDWLERWIEFEYKNANVRTQGILSSNQQELQEVSAEQVLK
jgi:hypothetical protein